MTEETEGDIIRNLNMSTTGDFDIDFPITTLELILGESIVECLNSVYLLEIRKALKDGLKINELKKYLIYPIEMFIEIRKAMRDNINIINYINKGYNTKVIQEIRLGLRKGIDITCYINTTTKTSYVKKIRKKFTDNKQYIDIKDIRSYA